MPNIPAYMRIRRHILGQLYKSSGQMEKIMSERELRELFNVSRVTVRNALKDLVNEGYLISFKGKGTYTNPEGRRPKREKLLGVLIGTGMLIAIDYFPGLSLSGILETAAKRNMSANIINIGLNDVESTAKELILSKCDGFIWLRPKKKGKEVIRILQNQGLPVLVVGSFSPDTDNYATTDMGDLGYQVALKLIEHDLSRTVFLIKKEYMNDIFAGWLKAFAEKRLAYDKTLFYEYTPHMFKNKFKEFIFSRQDVKAIFAIKDGIYEIGELQKETPDFKKYKIITGKGFYSLALNSQPFGLVDFPYKETAAAATDKLCNLLSGSDNKPIKIKLKSKLLITE